MDVCGGEFCPSHHCGKALEEITLEALSIQRPHITCDATRHASECLFAHDEFACYGLITQSRNILVNQTS